MTGSFNIVYPNNGRQLLDGGLNTKFERTLIAPNQSPDCQNVVFGGGAVATRGGSSQLNTTAIGTAAIDGIYTRHDNSGYETMVVFCNGSAWQLGVTTFTTIPSAQSVFTAGNRVTAAEYENRIFVGNGGVTPYKYDGTNFTRHGVPQATGTVSLASVAGGIPAGVYQYKVTYRNSAAVEGDVGTAFTITLSASGNVSVTGIPTAPQSHGVSSRRLYRTAGGGSTFKLLTTISDNTTTTYSDSTQDASLGADAPTDQGEPPKYSVCCYHQNRLFTNDATNRNYLWWSELGTPYTFKVTNFLKVGDNTGDLLYAIFVYQNNLVLGCLNSLFMVLMPSTDPTDWQTIRITAPFGTRSPFGAFEYQNKLMIPGTVRTKFVGFVAVSGTSIDPSATYLDNMTAGGESESNEIEPDMFDVVNAYISNISAITFNNRGYITLTKTASNTTNNYVYVFDYSITNVSKQQSFSWSRYVGLQASQFTIYNGNLYYGSSSAVGLVYQLETSSYTDGSGSTAINSYFWTKEFSGNPGHENVIKDFRKIKILIDVAGSYRMDLNYKLDSDNSASYTIPIDLTPTTAIWGTAIWGSSYWGSGSAQKEVEVSLGQVSGKRIQFKFSNQNTVSQRFKVHGLNYTYNVKGIR